LAEAKVHPYAEGSQTPLFGLVVVPASGRHGVSVRTSSVSGRLDLENLTDGDLRLLWEALDRHFEKRGMGVEAADGVGR